MHWSVEEKPCQMEEEVNPSVIGAGHLSGGEGNVDIPRHNGDPFRRGDRGWGGLAIKNDAESTPPATAGTPSRKTGGDQRRTTKARDERTPYGLRKEPRLSYKAGGSGKRAETAGEAPEGSSGWATAHGTLRVPYLLDTGATSSIVPEAVFNQLQDKKQLTLTTLQQPIRIVQADGSAILVDRIANISTILETVVGLYDLGSVGI